MPKKKLQPIIYRDSWHDPLAQYLYAQIKELIFDPLIDVVTNERLDNSKKTPLEQALLDGVIKYKDGVFTGRFWAQVSKEIKAMGGTFKNGAWYIKDYAMLFKYRVAIDRNKMLAAALDIAIIKKIDDIKDKITTTIKNMDFISLGNRNLIRVSEKFKQTVRKNLAIQPVLDERGLESISADYLTTIDLPIRKRLLAEYKDRTIDYTENFAQEVVEDLRRNLREMILAGDPRKDIQNYIMQRLKISRTRAVFIARQETALLTTKFKKEQYQQFGINQYIWQTVGDHKVRKRHLELDGETIDFNNPPVVDEKTGRRAHAGEDFRCRCVMQAIVEW